MVLYKDLNDLMEASKEDRNFIDKYPKDARAPVSGIYRCVNCGVETIKGEQEKLSDHPLTHDFSKGPILWRLIVATGVR